MGNILFILFYRFPRPITLLGSDRNKLSTFFLIPMRPHGSAEKEKKEKIEKEKSTQGGKDKNMRKDSFSNKIFKGIKFILGEIHNQAQMMGPTFEALMSRKTLGETLSAMPGYKGDEFGKYYSSSLSRLQKTGFIKFSDKDHFTLTEKGRGALVKFDIDDIQLPNFEPKNWDEIWRVIIFDIPELTRAVRNLFRAKIQELGFYTLQKSVYVTPVPCEKEIAEFSKLLNIAGGVDVLHAYKLGRKEKSVKKFFGIR